MNLLKNVLVVIAATAAVGSVQAQNIFNLEPISPNIQTRSNIYGEGSFADIFNFTVDATHNTLSASTFGLAGDGTRSSTSVTGLQFELFSGFNAPGTAKLFTGLDLNAEILTPGEFSAKISGIVGPLRGGYEFSVAASPEPAEWMLLLAGLVGLGFVARRKLGWTGGMAAAPA
jgi:MYXO-CTERM domain-containing protein